MSVSLYESRTKSLHQAHLPLAKADKQKPRANVEPFVRTVQPLHKDLSKDTPLITSPPTSPSAYHSTVTSSHSSAVVLTSPVAGQSNRTLLVSESRISPSQDNQHTSLHQNVPTQQTTPRYYSNTTPARKELSFPTTSTPIVSRRDSAHWPHPPNITAGNSNLSTDESSKTSSDTTCQNCQHLEQKVKFLTEANRELKRLLVASLGNDLKAQLEQLVHEKAAISCDLDISLKQLADNLETVDKVSIDCDIWRSKYFASRLMIDELANLKREMAQNLSDSQRALECLLDERNRLCETLNGCNLKLERMARLRAPLFQLPPHSGTVLDLTQNTNTLVQALSHHTYHLGGQSLAGGSKHSPSAMEPTRGERLAKEVLSSHDRDVQLPLKLNDSDISRHKLKSQSPTMYLLDGSVFHCSGCKGLLFHV